MQNLQAITRDKTSGCSSHYLLTWKHLDVLSVKASEMKHSGYSFFWPWKKKLFRLQMNNSNLKFTQLKTSKLRISSCSVPYFSNPAAADLLWLTCVRFIWKTTNEHLGGNSDTLTSSGSRVWLWSLLMCCVRALPMNKIWNMNNLKVFRRTSRMETEK